MPCNPRAQESGGECAQQLGDFHFRTAVVNQIEIEGTLAAWIEHHLAEFVALDRNIRVPAAMPGFLNGDHLASAQVSADFR